MKYFRSILYAGILLALSSQAFAYNISEEWRWKVSSYGKAAKRGDPIKVSWRLLADCKANPEFEYNNVNAFFEDKFSKGYLDLCRYTFGRIGDVSGLEFVELPYNPDPKKQNADIRVVGKDLNGTNACSDMPQPQGTLIRMSTVIGAKWSYDGWINVTMHEISHSAGLAHDRIYEKSDSKDPNLNASIVGLCNNAGPQFDDVYALNRLYGDKYERNRGNDTRETATNLGDVTSLTKSLGTNCTNALSIGSKASDFLSIDGSDDVDFVKFTISHRSWVSITVTPKGPTYEFIREGETARIKLEAGRQSDLRFEVFDSLGNRLYFVNNRGLGSAENALVDLPAGDYFIKVAGSKDNCQMYRLDVSASVIP